MKKETLLKQIDWHDLPLDELNISPTALTLVVTPYNEEARAYDSATLCLSECETLILDIRGELSPHDRAGLEVTVFDYQVRDDGSLSGKIGILPGSAGFWAVEFSGATWDLTLRRDSERPSNETTAP